MPVSFLSDDQRSRYGRYAGEPTAEQLARFFHLDDADREFIAACRGDHNRLGFALQLCTIRFLGTLLEDPRDVPAAVVSYVAHQLAVDDPSSHAQYCAGEQRWEHAAQIRTRCGYQDFLTWPAQFRLNRWLYALCWTGTDRPSVLFDRATTWLFSRKVLLPGVSVLERLVARVRNRVQERLWCLLIAGLSPHSHARLEALLTTPPGERKSQLELLRTGPVLRSGPELVRALRRLGDVQNLTLDVPVSARLPRSRVLELARFAATAKVTAIERMPGERRTAMLVAFVSTLQATAQDDALDVLEIVLTDIFSEAATAAKKARLRTLKDLDVAALQTANVSRVILDPQIGDSDVRQAVFKMMSRTDLEASVQQIDNIVRPREDVFYRELRGSFRRVRRFLPILLRTITFGASPAGQPLLEALEYMKAAELDAGKEKSATDPPLNIISAAWHKDVMGGGKVDLKAYTFCLLDRLRIALRRRDLFVTPSVRYADPRIGLLEGEAWESARPVTCRSLGLAASADEALAALRLELDTTYRVVATNFPNNRAVRIEQVDGKDDLILTALDKLDEPSSLVELRERVAARLPRVDLPEILLEIAVRTGFASEFTHVSERDSRVSDLSTSICAVLIAEACNTGIEPLVRNDVPALRRSRLSWVNQNYFRNETLTAANACLVAAQNRVPLVRSWGGGEVASADGLRFVVPVRTVHAGPNPKYFGMGHGVTYYNLVSNQFTGLNGIVVPGTLRDSLVLLAVVLEQQSELNPTEIMTDTGAYSDVVFGLFWLLGYRFSPRIADMGDSRLWRIDSHANYSPLNGVSRHKINTDLISQHWDDLLRLAGSLKLGLVQATSIMRTLQVGDRPTKLAQAVAEVGRIDKTVHILTSMNDESKRRRTLTQLNRGEDRHSLARTVFHGKRGELRQHYREGQEDQLGALGLVLNVIVLWNTIYMDAALEQLRNEGSSVNPEDVARLSPLIYDHINVLGRYAFALPDFVASGQLRQLRRGDAADDDA
jgi:TnpA family transposase